MQHEPKQKTHGLLGRSKASVAQVPVYAAAKGTVVYVQRGCPQSALFGTNYEQRNCGSGWGNHVVIRHPNGLWTRYAHLQPDSIKVQVLQRVERGEPLAEMGNSGQSNTRHLHFEVGVAIEFDPCTTPQPFQYVYDPATHLNWLDLQR